jgi:hypothetical protein
MAQSRRVGAVPGVCSIGRALIVNKNDGELGKAVGGLAKRGLMADLIQEWILTRDHFKVLATLCDTAVCWSSRVISTFRPKRAPLYEQGW